MILQGGCRDRMAEMEDNSIDAIVCDPPYGLSKEPDIVEVLTHWLNGDDYTTTGGGFMGKTWDSFVPGPATWRECYRVLKPGGYLLAMASSRTSDLMGISIRLAGFITHPIIGWAFGSGFPKATNLSKMIDKHRRRDYVKAAIGLGLSIPGNSLHDWTKAEHAPGDKWWDEFKRFLSPEDWGRIEREVIGKDDKGKAIFGSCDGEYDITTPATDAARQWDGWYYGRQSLKPALEPICVAQKPPDGRMVDNVLRWGCGAMNIDASRIGTDTTRGDRYNNRPPGGGGGSVHQGKMDVPWDAPSGRWPANLILGHAPGCVRRGEKRVKVNDKEHNRNNYNRDSICYGKYNPSVTKGYADSDGMETVADWLCQEGCPVRLISEQSGHLKSGDKKPHKQNLKSGVQFMTCKQTVNSFKGDEGTAARFFLQIPPDPDPIFYCAKSSKSERNNGLDGTCTVKLIPDDDLIDRSCRKDANMAAVQLLQKVTSESTVKWGIGESGESITALCRRGSLSTILTEINKIIESRILNLLMLSLTSESMPDALSSMEPGGNHVENVESLNQWILNITGGKMELARGVANVALIMLSKTSESANWRDLSNIHSTVKPLKLMRYLVRLVTPPGGVVLDPFAGSGTTLIAAKEEGFNFIGIELEPEYIEIAEARLAAAERPPATLEDFAPCTVAGLRKDTAGICTLSGPSDHTIRFSTFQ